MTVTEMGGLCEERFGRIGRGMGDWKLVVETALIWDQ